MTPPQNGRFPTTQWTLIRRLGSSDESVARPALAELCAQYRFPLYCFIRRRGLDHHDAEDALHDFFSKLLRLESFAYADPAKGRLRSYLATALHRFLSDWRQSNHSPPPAKVLPLIPQFIDSLRARYENEPANPAESPEAILDRQWARELLAGALTRLRESQTARGKGRLFECLLPVLLAGGRLEYGQSAVLAAELGISEGSVRVALSRLLREYRQVLEARVLDTVASRDLVPGEISHLLSLFSRP